MPQRYLEEKERNINQTSGDYMAKVLKNQAGYINRPIRVPLYQRPYTWKKLKVQQLFDDLVEHLESDVYNAYYLGQLVFVIKNGIPEVLDGQQRLTTFYVFISALVNSYYKLRLDIAHLNSSDINKQDFFNDIDDEIQILYSYLINRDEQQRFMPHYTDDKKHFSYLLKRKCIINYSDIRNTGITKRNRMISAAFLLYKNINEYVDEKSNINNTSSDLSLYYRNQFNMLNTFKNILTGDFVEISYTVLKEGIEFTIFETLNNRGEDLNCYDLTRNILINISAQNFIDYRNESITIFDEIIKNNCSPGKRFDEKLAERLMTATWNMSNPGKISTGKYMKKFIEFVKDPDEEEGDFQRRSGRLNQNGENLKERFVKYVKKLENCSHAYFDLLNPKKILEREDGYGTSTRNKEQLSKLLHLFNKTGFKQHIPIFLALRHKGADIQMILKYINLIEKIYVNFILVFDRSPSDIESEMSRIAFEIYKYSSDINEQIYDDHKKAINTLSKAKNINNDDFVKLFSRIEVTNKISTYLLLRIILERGGLPIDVYSPTLSLEHVMPENPDYENEWSVDCFLQEQNEGGQFVEYRLDKELHAKYIMRFGNHTILTIPDNSELSNKSFTQKLETYNIEEMPFITKGDEPSSVTAYDTWNANAINSRQKALSEIAKTIWGF